MEDEDESPPAKTFDPAQDVFPPKETQLTKPLDKHLVDALRDIQYTDATITPYSKIKLYMNIAANGLEAENVLRHTWYKTYASGKTSQAIGKYQNPMNQLIEYYKDHIQITFAAPRAHRTIDDIKLLLRELAINDFLISRIVHFNTATGGEMKQTVKQTQELTKCYADYRNIPRTT